MIEFEQEESVRAEAKRLGIDLIGFSPMNEQLCLREDWKDYLNRCGYCSAITLAAAISVSSCDLLLKKVDQGSLFYFEKHVKGQAEAMDAAAEKLCRFIETRGYRAFHVPGLGTAYRDGDCRTILSHITHARLSGIGSMGDSGMLLTREFGPRVRLTTILTNCVLSASEELEADLCTHCGACMVICPSGSITGGRFDEKHPKRCYTNKNLCAAHRDENKKRFGSRFCNLCMAVCPIGEDKKSWNSQKFRRNDGAAPM